MKKALLIGMALSCLILCGSKLQAQEHEHKHKKGSANEFMHRSSVDQLVQRFESPERDAYQQPEKVIDYLGDIKGKKVMDIGAGSGYFSVRLAAAGAKVIAADVNDEFQDFIGQRIEKEGLQDLGIELRKLPYDDPLLRDGEVDMVFMVNTYHHIEDRPVYFSKAKKGLAKGGELVIIDYFKSDIPVGPPVGHKVSMDVVVSELKAAGFEDFEVNVNLLPYQFIIRAGCCQ